MTACTILAVLNSSPTETLLTLNWFIDDGQVQLRLRFVDTWRRFMDDVINTFGGTTAEGCALSSAWLLCLRERRHEFQGWDTLHVRSTVKVLQPYDDTNAL